MVIKNVSLETVCGITSRIPDNPYPEIAFAGKSNVGKSSLINALLNRKSLARTSSRPGKTQTINFYNINDVMYLVDLPGYGYASAGVEIKAKWGKMIENYLHVSRMLCAVFLLVDIRHDPSENDRMMYDWIRDQGFAPVIIATKADKIKRSQLGKHINAIRTVLELLPETPVIPFSAETKQGREEIWELMEELARTDQDEDPQSTAFKEGASKEGGSQEGTLQKDASGEEQQPFAQEESGGKKERKPRWKAIGRKNPKKAAKAKAADGKKKGSKKPAKPPVKPTQNGKDGQKSAKPSVKATVKSAQNGKNGQKSAKTSAKPPVKPMQNGKDGQKSAKPSAKPPVRKSAAGSGAGS